MNVSDQFETFRLFFDDNVIEILLDETNWCHTQDTNDDPTWTNVQKEEMMAFLGLVLAIGLVNLPELSDYWSTESIMHFQWFSAVMPRARFIAIHSHYK